jgi:hypothetical protein
VLNVVSRAHERGSRSIRRSSKFVNPIRVANPHLYFDADAGFGDSSECLVGMNYYPFKTRNHRLNAQIIDVNKSPASSSFGYYTGGQDGLTFATSFSIFF